jgi:hypothetical protein
LLEFGSGADWGPLLRKRRRVGIVFLVAIVVSDADPFHLIDVDRLR